MAGKLPPARQAALRAFRDPESHEVLDRGIVLRFDAPASATGEDLVELHIHGGRAVADAIQAALAAVPGCRAALPGEFTRRAFENGRIDLTEAEGLADLLEAETELQRKSALAVAEGGLRRRIEGWQQTLLALSARAEAAIDYSDEIEDFADAALKRDCAAFASELRNWLEQPRVEPLRDGIRVVVAGPPNAGKSSLINRICGSERAIVTDVPGTTRDHIEVPLSLDGLPIVLTDTAGLRESADRVERIGIARAWALAETADVLLWLGDPDLAPDHPRLVLVHAQADRREQGSAPPDSIAVSSVTGEGVLRLLARLAELARSLIPAEDPIALNRRQAAHVAEAETSVVAAAEASDIVLAAEDLRCARGAFDRLTGRAGVEDVLDALFGRFCLGK